MTVTLQFCGAAGMVTGACYLVRWPGGRFLVDCGLFQGAKTLRELNYGAFPFDPRTIDLVLLTHAHIDHSGLLPKLALRGFRGAVHATGGTADLLNWMLPDAANIQESEVVRLNRRNQRRGRAPVEPIYTRRDAEQVLRQIARRDYDSWVEPMPGLRVRFWNAGHILGSSSIEVEIATGRPRHPKLRLLFSGDIGPVMKPLQVDAEGPKDIDLLVLESTYGGRRRLRLDDEQRRQALRTEVATALARGGNLVVPSFAVERTQEFLFDLLELMARGDLPRAPVFLDSPLAIRATEVFERHLDPSERAAHTGANPFRAPNVRYVLDAEDSYQIGQIKGGAIIMAASGMCEAGRIRTHLRNNLWRDRATVLLIGYQAPGTLGALLEQGVKAVRIHGEEVAVNAEIRRIDLYSGHADHDDLVAWAKARQPIRRGVFVTHGDDQARAALGTALRDLGIEAAQIVQPTLDETYALDRGRQPVPIAATAPPRIAAEDLRRGLGGRDWHNDYAALVLDLQKRLREARSDETRGELLRRIRGLIAGDA